jgi:hypothetical protein
MKKFSELSEEILTYELAIQIQEGNITEEELEDLHEVLPALVIGGKLLGGALSAYSGYQAAKNLRKGNYKQAGLDAIGMVPGGKVFKGLKFLGAGKKLAKAGSFAQSLARHGTDNAFSRTVDKGYEGLGHALRGRNPFNKKLYQKSNKQVKPTTVKPSGVSTSPKSTTPSTSAPKGMSFKGGLGYSVKKPTKVGTAGTSGAKKLKV